MNEAPFRLPASSVWPASILLGTFSWSFVYVSLPFHVQAMSGMDAAATLRWTGWILGVTPLVTIVVGPWWGRYAEARDPRALYVWVQRLQALAFIGMAMARTLPELFVSRLVLGFFGSSSTFAFILAGREPKPLDVRRRVAAVQSAMTIGQVVGPLVGALAAARLGFRPSFVVGGLILFAASEVVHLAAPPARAREAKGPDASPTNWREVMAVSLLIVGGSTQILFLVAVLPRILPLLDVAPADTLEIGGVLIFTSGVAVALGSIAAPRLSELASERRLIPVLFLVSSLLVLALAPLESLWLYGAVRFVQVLCIAPVFPIVVARVAHVGGQAIGVINSARIAASFVGPVLATTLLTWGPPALLYVVLAAVGATCLPLTLRRRGAPAA